MSTPTVRTPQVMLARLEKDEYEQGCSLLRQLGWVVYRLSQPRASKQSLGVADTWVMHPNGRSFWWEVKRDVGKQSPAQQRFQALCRECGVTHVIGGVRELLYFLQRGEILAWPRSLQTPEQRAVAEHMIR